MAKIYAKRIKARQMTLADVPEKWRAEVEKLLDVNNDGRKLFELAREIRENNGFA